MLPIFTRQRERINTQEYVDEHAYSYSNVATVQIAQQRLKSRLVNPPDLIKELGSYAMIVTGRFYSFVISTILYRYGHR